MQITIPRGELKDAVSGFGKIIPNKSTLPVLGCVRFENSGKGVTAQVTDLDQTARYRFAGAQAQGNGAFIVPLATLKEMAKGNDKETLEFETGGNNTITVTNHVGAHAVKHPVAGMDPDEWPVGPKEAGTKPAAGFLDTYRRLVPFASTDTTRYVLNSVYVEVADSGEHPVTMVATDGRRLSLWNTMNLPLQKSVIVPTTKFLQWKELKPGEEQLGLRTEPIKKELRVLGLTLDSGPWVYDVKAVDGQYPNWRQVVPGVEETANRLTFTDDDVTALRKILPTFPGANTDSAMIALRPGSDGKLVIGGRGRDDKADTTLELTGGSRFDGKLQGVGVNAFFLLDALEAGFREFTTTDELNALRAQDGRGGIHVLMPMRLGPQPVKPAETQPEPVTAGPEGNGVTGTPEQAGGAATPAVTPPAEIPPAADDHNKKGAQKRMTKEANGNGTENQTALDKVLAAVETARAKLRESALALAEVTEAVKTAHREGRAQAGDLEKARATLQKLQAISL